VNSDEDEEVIVESIEFVINESKSTSSSKFVVRKRTVLHRIEKEDKEWSEVFEETFTIPLHKFNMSLILSQTKIENVEETVVVSRRILRKKLDGASGTEQEEIELPTESARDLESRLPMIDFTDITNIRMVETRRQIVTHKVS
jgi:hypothetical protein